MAKEKNEILKEIEKHGYKITLKTDGVFVNDQPVSVLVIGGIRQICLPSGHYLFLSEIESPKE